MFKLFLFLIIIGYVVSGVVLGVGIFILLVFFDYGLVEFLENIFGGWFLFILIGLVFVLVLVYCVWFFVIV